MNLEKILNHLKEIKQSVIKEIGIHLVNEGGYFSVVLIFFSIVLEMSEKLNGKYCNHFKDEMKFIFDYFPDVYRGNFEGKGILNYFYKIYRHGLAHRYTPQNYEIEKHKLLTWFIYKAPHNTKFAIQGTEVLIEHFSIIHFSEAGKDLNFPNYEVYVLPININRLYEDLLVALDSYIADIESNQNLQTKFNQWKDNVWLRVVRCF